MRKGTLGWALSRPSPTLFRRKLVFAGSFDPIAKHHLAIIEQMVAERDRRKRSRIPISIVIWPGNSYDGKDLVAPAPVRREMLLAAVAGLGVEVITTDLDFGTYTPTAEMQAQLSATSMTSLHERYMTTRAMPVIVNEIHHVIGADNVPKIKEWDDGHKLWKHARFLIVPREGYELEEVPPNAAFLDPIASGRCTDIRQLIAIGGDWEGLVPSEVAAIIKREKLYGYRG